MRITSKNDLLSVLDKPDTSIKAEFCCPATTPPDRILGYVSRMTLVELIRPGHEPTRLWLGEDEEATGEQETWDKLEEAMRDEGMSDWRLRSGVKDDHGIIYRSGKDAGPRPDGIAEVTAPGARIAERVRLNDDVMNYIADRSQHGAEKKLAFAMRRAKLCVAYQERPIDDTELKLVTEARLLRLNDSSVSIEDYLSYYLQSKAAHVAADGSWNPDSLKLATTLMSKWSLDGHGDVRDGLTRSLRLHDCHEGLLDTVMKDWKPPAIASGPGH